MKYEDNGNIRILKNIPFTENKTHISFGKEDLTQYNNTLSSNPNYSHIVYAPQDNVRDMKAIKGYAVYCTSLWVLISAKNSDKKTDY